MILEHKSGEMSPWILTLAASVNKAGSAHQGQEGFLQADAFSKTASKYFFQGAFKNKHVIFKN